MNNNHLSHVRYSLVLCLLTVLSTGFAGCARLGYNLGSMLPLDIKTVFVPLLINQTNEPNIEGETTRAVIDFIQRDGSLKIANRDTADARLQVILTRFQIVPIAFDQDRRTAAEEYRMYLTASVRLIRQSNGEILAENPSVRGESTFPLQGDLTKSKSVGLPEAAKDLAHDIVEKIVEYW